MAGVKRQHFTQRSLGGSQVAAFLEESVAQHDPWRQGVRGVFDRLLQERLGWLVFLARQMSPRPQHRSIGAAVELSGRMVNLGPARLLNP